MYVFFPSSLSLIDVSLKVKGTFLAAICVFEIGSLICALAPSSIVLIVGRAIAGIGVGGLFSGALVIMAHTSLYPYTFSSYHHLPLVSASSETAHGVWAIGRHVWCCFSCWSPTRRCIHRSHLMALVFLHQASISLTQLIGTSTYKFLVFLLVHFRSSLSLSFSSFRTKRIQRIYPSRSVYQI